MNCGTDVRTNWFQFVSVIYITNEVLKAEEIVHSSLTTQSCIELIIPSVESIYTFCI